MSQISKVYIVTQGEYSDYRIKAVFTDKEQAIYYAALRNDSFDPSYVEEYAVDEVTIDTPPALADKWTARISFDGHLESFYQEEGYHVISPSKVLFSPWKGGRYTVIIYVPEATPFEKAKKILFDTFAKWKYERMEMTP